MDEATFTVFLFATLALNLTPGPDMLYVTARSLGQGRRAGAVSALGVGGGIVVHTLAVALGLAALLASVPLAYEVVRYAGAAYLLYLGLHTLFKRETIESPVALKRDSLWQIFRQGVITNVLNPKVALFFLAFLPQFVDPERGPAGLQVLVLGMIFNISGTLFNIAVALLVGLFGDHLRRRPALASMQRVITGGIFIALALRLAIPEQRR
jgi:threonine/homoserine/homoserine lactone efflux protein